MGMCTHINKDYLDCDPAQKLGGFWSMITIYMYQWKSIPQWRHLVSKTLIQIDNNSNLIVLDHKHCLRTHTQILVG